MLTFAVLLIIVLVVSKKYRSHVIAKQYGYRVSKKSHDTFVYSQKVNGKWEEIEIDRTYHRGKFFIDFKSADEWKAYPLWAQDRDLIMRRVLSFFPNNEKKYDEIDDIGKS